MRVSVRLRVGRNREKRERTTTLAASDSSLRCDDEQESAEGACSSPTRFSLLQELPQLKFR